MQVPRSVTIGYAMKLIVYICKDLLFRDFSLTDFEATVVFT